MAKHICQIWGAESGGDEELSVVGTGNSSSQTQVRSGDYSYYTEALNTYDPYESNSAYSGKYIIGGAFWVADATSTQTTFLIVNDTTPSQCIALQRLTDGTVRVLDNAGATIGTTTATLSDSTWHFIEIYFDIGNSTAGELFIDDTSVLTWSAEDTQPGSATGIGNFQAGGNSTDPIYIDDLYFMAECSATSDRLRDFEIFPYFSTKTGVTPDYGNDLDSGAWVTACTVPFPATVSASYTPGSSTLKRGEVLTNDAGGSADTGGPNTDANVDGDDNIVAMKGVWAVKRGGGSLAIHNLRLGGPRNTLWLQAADQPLLTTSEANRNICIDKSAYSIRGWYHPTAKAIGFGGSTGSQINWKPDGTAVYGRTSGGVIQEYTLTTAWDIDSFTTGDSWDIETALEATSWGVTGAGIVGFCFSSDGTRMYFADVNGDYIYEATLSTAWDITTATINETDRLASNSVEPALLWLVEDDTILFNSCTSYGDTIDTYTFSTAKDISTLSFTRGGYQPPSGGNSQATHILGWEYSGEVLYLVSRFENKYAVCDKLLLSTAWDLSTATTMEEAVAWNATNTYAYGGAFGNDGQVVLKQHEGTMRQFDKDTAFPAANENLIIGMQANLGAQTIDIYGMVAMIGHVPNLANDYTLQCTAGSFSLSGQTNAFKRGYHLDSDAGSITLTGQTADLTHTALSYEFEGYRFRDDDGNETAATWRENQDTVTTQRRGVNVRLRTLIDADGNPASAQVTLQYRKVGDAEWKTVP